MRRKLCKKLSWLCVLAMCMSLTSVPAFAAEAADSGDGRTTTITTEITWASPEGEEPVVEGAAVTTETTVLDEEGRIVQESGSETGHETTTAETVTSGTMVEDKEPETETAEGETITTETPGEFETVDNTAASSSEAIDPVFKGGDSSITVDLTPGSTATGTAEVDKEALAGQLARPDEEDSEITDPGTGESIGHKTVTVEDVLDEDGAVVGFTATTTEETSVTTTLPEGVSGAEPPEMPRPQEPFTDTDGVTTKVDVAPIYDGDGNLTGYQTTTTKTSITGTAMSETVLPERPTEGEAIDPETGETTAVTVAELRDTSGALTGYEVTTTTTDREGNVRTAVRAVVCPADGLSRWACRHGLAGD